MEKRVEQLEEDVRALREDAVWIKERLGHTATKNDVTAVQLGIAALKGDMKGGISNVETKLVRWMLGVAAVALTVAKLIF